MAKSALGWWFCAVGEDGQIRLPHGDGRIVTAGGCLSVEPPIKACSRGLHASVRAIDALRYAPGSVVCRVHLSGKMDRQDDKIAAQHREVLWMADASVALRLFACDVADATLHAERKAGREPDPRSWEAVRVAALYAQGKATEAERNAAESAAWSAAESAAYAARSAAESAAYAARSAAYAAESAAYAAWSAAESAAHAARSAAESAAYAAWSAAYAAESAAYAAESAQNRLLTKRLRALAPRE